MQFFKDHNSLKDIYGNEVDVYHLAVGLEAIQADYPTVKLPSDVLSERQMESLAITTWAGDIGAALADWYCTIDAQTEKKLNLGNNVDAQLNHYWKTRASSVDLDSDIDAWGIHYDMQKVLPSNLRRFSDVLLYYYGKIDSREKRKNSFRKFAED